MITFHFRLTEDEYFEYNYYTAWASPSRKRYRIMYFLKVIGLYGGVALLYILSSRSHILWVDALVFAITGVLYLGLVPFFVRASVKRKVRNILSRKENQHVLEDAEIILSDQLIIDKDTVSETKYTWDAITKFAETPSSLYLYTNTYHAIVIPKRVIGNASQKQELDEMLERNLPLDAQA